MDKSVAAAGLYEHLDMFLQDGFDHLGDRPVVTADAAYTVYTAWCKWTGCT